MVLVTERGKGGSNPKLEKRGWPYEELAAE
jgi:hypothetical protein